jgi:iron(III) transport system substrate-binding protein
MALFQVKPMKRHKGGYKVKRSYLFLIFIMLLFIVPAAIAAPPTIVIYSSAEDYRIAYFQQRLGEQFPDYGITIEYMPTGTHAAKLQAEGLATPCDISFDMEYSYFDLLEDYLAYIGDLYDSSVFTDDLESVDIRSKAFEQGMQMRNTNHGLRRED